MRAGLIPAKDSLEAEAERDTAQVILVQTRYQEAIARATLDLAMGTTLLPETDLKKEE
jgi:outer membrane protein TolC